MIRAINELAAAGMLTIESDQSTCGPDRLTSRHDLLSNVALSYLTPPARAFLHRRIGTVFESEIDISAALMWESARHWQLAGDDTRALALVKACAAHLLNVGLPGSAAETYEKALLYSASVYERFEVLRDLARAYHLCTAWPEVQETVHKGRALQRRIDPNTEHHDDLELMGLRAEWQCGNTVNTVIKTLSCLQTDTADAMHRVEAGTLALILLDLTCQRDAMTDAYSLIEKISAEHGIGGASILEARMIYHTVCGSLPKAVEVSRDLLALETTRASCGDLFRRLMNAAGVFRAAGLRDEAIQLINEAQQLAEVHRMPTATSRLLPRLGHWELELGHIESATRCYERAIDITAPGCDFRSRRDIACLGTRLALWMGNAHLAQQRFGLRLNDVIRGASGQDRTYELALCVAIAMSKGVVSLHAVSALEEAHVVSRRNLGHAFECLVLHRALRSIGRSDDADRLLQEYTLEFRREVWPIPPSLFEEVSNFGTRESPETTTTTIRNGRNGRCT
jgi:tetratricopeptide (TPR) repeat protein